MSVHVNVVIVLKQVRGSVDISTSESVVIVLK